MWVPKAKPLAVPPPTAPPAKKQRLAAPAVAGWHASFPVNVKLPTAEQMIKWNFPGISLIYLCISIVFLEVKMVRINASLTLCLAISMTLSAK